MVKAGQTRFCRMNSARAQDFYTDFSSNLICGEKQRITDFLSRWRHPFGPEFYNLNLVKDQKFFIQKENCSDEKLEGYFCLAENANFIIYQILKLDCVDRNGLFTNKLLGFSPSLVNSITQGFRLFFFNFKTIKLNAPSNLVVPE